MINLSFSYYDLEYFLLILVRVSCFIFVAPFFSMNNTPRQVRIVIAFFTSALLYSVLSPAEAVEYNTVTEYAILVLKEAIAGLLLGFSTMVCTAIVNFTGSLVDMETGLSMAQVMDPTTKQMTSLTGALYQYLMMLLLIASGMYRYLLGAAAQSFVVIPVGGAVFRGDNLLAAMVEFMVDYIMIGFQICLPVFCVMLLLNAILGVLTKVSPQMNMFSVGIQLKVLVGLSVLFFTMSMLPSAASYVFEEMRKLTVSFVEGMI